MSDNVQDVEWVLASSSPRRAQLLKEAGYRFRVRPSDVEEPPYDHFASGEAYAVHAAWLKATCVAKSESGWVLGADTVVTLGSMIVSKPSHRKDAERMLRSLMGTRHACITGICLVLPAGRPALVDHVSTVVEMKRLTEPQLAEYLESGDWEGKAGAYGIQDANDPFVRVVEGSWSNVVGLPMERLAEIVGMARRAAGLELQP